jgi:hypothetical protein
VPDVVVGLDVGQAARVALDGLLGDLPDRYACTECSILVVSFFFNRVIFLTFSAFLIHYGFLTI